MLRRLPAIAALLVCSAALRGAETFGSIPVRQIAWLSYSGDHRVRGRWGVHFDGSFRFLHDSPWRQWLVRPGVNVGVSRSVSLQAAYSHFRTYADGFGGGLGAAGEHRMHEQVVWAQRWGVTAIRSRFRAEQRWFGTAGPSAFQHRFRYMLRAELPLKRAGGEDPVVYLAPFDEVMVRFADGQPGNFDQNRLGAMGGWRLGRRLAVEAGGFHQWFRQPATGRVENNNVFVLLLISRAPLTRIFARQ